MKTEIDNINAKISKVNICDPKIEVPKKVNEDNFNKAINIIQVIKSDPPNPKIDKPPQP